MTEKLLDAINRLAAAMEKQNEKEETKATELVQGIIQGIATALEDKLLMKRITKALEGLDDTCPICHNQPPAPSGLPLVPPWTPNTVPSVPCPPTDSVPYCPPTPTDQQMDGRHQLFQRLAEIERIERLKTMPVVKP